jgi:dienelactone hydrolase
MARKLLKALLRTVAALLIFAIFALLALFASLWLEHRTATTLPTPTGHFAVGRTQYVWRNDAQTDDLAPPPSPQRQVLVWIWYPSAPAMSAEPVEYLPAPWRMAEAQYSGVLMSRFLTRDLSLVRAHSTSGPQVSPEQRAYPVVIMRAGGGALTTDFTTLAEDLASHGYIVVGFDAPYRTSIVVLPDQRAIARPPEYDPENLPADQTEHLINSLLRMWTDDTKFVVDQLQRLNQADPPGRFTSRLDLQRLGMLGHSFGGAQALQFCHDDVRCKAGIDIDGAPYGSVVQEGLKQPFMFILSDHRHESSDPVSEQIGANIHSIYDRLPNGRLFIIIRGANHFSFSDQMLVKSQFFIGLLRIAGFARLDGRRGLSITADYVHTFFDVYLNGAPPALLAPLSSRYPEVRVEPR